MANFMVAGKDDNELDRLSVVEKQKVRVGSKVEEVSYPVVEPKTFGQKELWDGPTPQKTKSDGLLKAMKPGDKETQAQWMERCMPEAINAGKKPDAASGYCMGVWNKKKS